MPITTLAYKIVADTSGFTSGMVMTRRELSASRRLFEETRTPVEQYEMALKGLEQLQGKGLSADVVQRSIRKLREEFWGLDRAVSETADPVDNLFAKIAGGVTVGNLLSRAFTEAFQFIQAGARALADNVGEQFRKSLNFGKIVDRTGIDAGVLAGFELAAGRVGLEFDTAAKALQKMQVRLGEAARGSGEAAATLKALGLDAKRLAELPVERQFAELAKAIREAGNETQQLSLATKIFEADGADIARLFDMTAEDLAAATVEAERLGLAIDETDLAQIAEANAAIKEMEELWAGVGRTLAVEVAPFIKSAVDVMTIAVEQARSLSDTVAAFGESAVGAVIIQGVKTGVGAGLGAGTGMGGVMTAAAYAGESYGGLVADTRAAVESERRAKDMEREREAAKNAETNALRDFNKKLYDRLHPDRKEGVDGVSVKLFDAAKRKADEAAREAERAWKKMVDDGRRAAEEYATPLDKIANKLGGLRKLLSVGAIDAATFNRAVNAEVKSLVDKELNETPAGPNVAVEKGTRAAVSAEQERLRYERDREQREERREQLKLQVLNRIAANTDPATKEQPETVGI